MPAFTRSEIISAIGNLDSHEELDLSDKDLRGLNLSSLDLRQVIFTRCDMRNANLSNARLEKTAPISRLDGTDFTGANMEGAYLYGVNLEGAILAHANLRKAKFIFTKGHGAIFDDADLTGAELEQSLLGAMGEGWFRSEKPAASMKRAILRNAKAKSGITSAAWTWWVLVDLSGADLSGADFWYAELTGVNLYRAILDKTNFAQAELKHANFCQATMRNTNLYLAKLHEANLEGAILNNVVLKGAVCNGGTVWHDPNFKPVVAGVKVE